MPWAVDSLVARLICSPVTKSTAKDHIDPTQDDLKLCPRDSSNVLREHRSVNGHDLRDVRDRILGQPGAPCLQEHVAGSGGPAEIARQRHHYYRRQAARVKGIALNDYDWSCEARTGANRIRQRGPKDVSLGDYHSLRSKVRRPASASHGSGFGSMSARAASMAWVSAPGSRRSKYSDNASWYSWLRDLPVFRAISSALLKSSSGIETAVFIPEV